MTRRPVLTLGLLIVTMTTACVPQRSRREFGPGSDTNATPPSAMRPSSNSLHVDPESDGFDPQTGHLSMAGAINETVTFELRLRASGTPVRDVDVAVGPLHSQAGALRGARLRLYRVHPVSVRRWPGWYVRTIDASERQRTIYDVVVPVDAPRGGLPTSLETGESLRFFAELHIGPRGTPGEYSTEVTISVGGWIVRTIPLGVTVWPFALPEVTDVTLLSALDHHALFRHHIRIGGVPYMPLPAVGGSADPQLRGRLDKLLTQTVRMLHAHGVTPIFDRLYPRVKVHGAGYVSIDWTDFDQVMSEYLDGLDPANPGQFSWYRIPLGGDFPAFGGDAPRDPKLDTEIIEGGLTAYAEHFAERGWLERAFVRLPEPPDRATDPINFQVAYAELVRRADPRLRTLSSLFAQVLSRRAQQRFQRSGLGELIDIWCPPAQFRDTPPSSGGRDTWMRLDRPPFSGTLQVHARPSYVRVIPWQARRYGISKVDIGPAMPWPESVTNATPQDCVSFNDATLLYPGSSFGLDHPVASMRLKNLRRGMQDLAYLKLLKTRGLEHVAESLADILCPYALTDAYGNHFADARSIGWVGDPQLWELGRQTMADELQRTEDGRSMDAVVRWRQLIDRARHVTVAIDGVRVRPTREKGTNRVSCWVKLENWSRVDVGGRLSFERLPMGWTTAEPESIVAPIAPMNSSVVVLTAMARTMTSGVDGTARLPILFRSDDGDVYRIDARLGYVTSRRIDRPIRIDGDLSDWPTAAGNVASGFIPITGRSAQRGPTTPSTVPDPSGESAAGSTRCTVAHDRNALYIGVYQPAHGSVPAIVEHRSSVAYEDMIPMGEEVVEVLLDPTNAGTHDAADLYHILIKRAGAVFERGVGTDPPCGRRSVWAADIDYAYKATADAWTIELRVPFDALEFAGSTRSDPAPGIRILGINFTYYDAGDQIYRTWSGAVHNAYDPMSLGNLMLP